MTKESASKLFDRLKWVIALAIFGTAVVGNSYFSDIAFSFANIAFGVKNFEA